MTSRSRFACSVALIALVLLAGVPDTAGASRSNVGSWTKVTGLETTWATGRPIMVTDLTDPRNRHDDAGVAWVSGAGGIRAALEPGRQPTQARSYVVTQPRHRALRR